MVPLARQLTPLEEDQVVEDEEIDEGDDTTPKKARPVPALLRRRSTRRRPVYTAQHVMLVVDFSKDAFRAVWTVTFIVRLWCILFLAYSARLYWFVAHPYMSYYASLIGPTAVANFKPMGVVFGVFAVLHSIQVLKMVWYSIQYRELVLGPPPHSLGPNGDSLCFRDWGSRFRSPRVFIRTFKRDFKRLFFDRHGPFGVESSLFYLRFLANELVEIASQTTQVYNASVLVSKVWMNNLYVTLTVLNCWSTPLIRFLFHKFGNPSTAALERVACLCADFVLDATTAMVIPLLIFLPYYQKFDFSAYNFELVYLYDDIWFANMVMENQQLLAKDKWDFLWKMVPHLSIYFSLNSIRALLRPPRVRLGRIYCAEAQRTEPSRTAEPIQPVEPQQPPQLSSHPPVTTTPPSPQQPSSGAVDGTDTAGGVGDWHQTLKPKAAKIKEKKDSLPPIEEGKRLTRPSVGAITRQLSFLNDLSAREAHEQGPGRRMLQFLMKIILFLSGLVLLVLHLRAAWNAYTTEVISCATRTRPWFASKASCSVVRHNCHMHNATGVTNADFAMIEPDSVGALVLSHCPRMHVPTVITTFHNMLGIDFYNCTMHEWSVEAAITAEVHPQLTYIIMVHVNMTRLPDGILQSLPDTMTDFEVVISNLTALPLDLDEKWHPMSLFYLEHTQITEFPPALTRLHVDDLSLIGNKIERLPEFDADVSFFTLAMTHTPLLELPTSIGNTENIGFLDFAYTKLQSFPPWMDQVTKTASKIYVHHTPFCDSKSELEIAESFGEDAVLSCSDTNDVRQNGKYPLDILAPKRLYDDPDMVPTTTQTVDTSDASVGKSTPGDP